MNKSYKLYCKELDQIVSIKSFSPIEEGKVYEDFKSTLTSSIIALDIGAYRMMVVDTLLVDASSYYTIVPEEIQADEGLVQDLVSALYDTVIEAYPHFDFDFVCSDINNSIALEHMHSLFQHVANQRNAINTVPKGIRTLNDIKRVERVIKRKIIGQDDACEKVMNAIKLIVAGLHKSSAFFFIGPTGVGKTKLGRCLGENYSGNFFKVNCGEYSSAHDYSKLIGAPPGYVGHTDKSILAEKAEHSNMWVILFDEIEKAHPKFYDFLLSLLDDGTCTDNLGRELDFSESIFIFTSNHGILDAKIGNRLLGFDSQKVSYSTTKNVLLESIKKRFSPEFLNRIDHIIFFNQLSDGQLRKIASLELAALPIKKNKGLLDYIIKNSNSEEYGARNVAKFIKNNVSIKVAEAILDKRVPDKGNLYLFKIKEDNLFISNLKEDNHGSQKKEA